ncbi:hypothetical protein [Microbulbifer sp. MCCC 1A16149]|uniref:hypothetical protein n=1 Tax=Microbulbifer sp. MCCC 1A16149 TaxID=3411322 RepID=UPI003D0C7B48
MNNNSTKSIQVDNPNNLEGKFFHSLHEDLRRNILGARVWNVECIVSGVFPVDWTKLHPEIENNIEKLVLIQNWALGYLNKGEASLIYRKSTFNHLFTLFKRFCEYWIDKDPIDLNRWSEESIINCLVYCSKREDGLFKARDWVRQTFEKIKSINRFYLNGTFSDGFVTFPYLETFFGIVEAEIEDSGTDLLAWKLGGRWESIPIQIAMLLVSDAVNLLRSPKTKCARAIYKWINDHPDIALPEYTRLKINLPKVIYRESKLSTGLHGLRHPMFQSLRSYLEYEFNVGPDDDLPISDWPFCTPGDVNRHVRELYTSCAIIFLAITGARRSEIHSIRYDGLVKGKFGRYKFKSEILKTNYGIVTLRDISGLAAEVVDVIWDMSIEDPEIRSTQRIFEYRKMSLQLGKRAGQKVDLFKDKYLRAVLSEKYKSFVDVYGSEYLTLCDSIHPHKWRHTFSEFAMRRFDGNVPGAIRDHYRHSFDSYMTSSYLFNKLYEEDDYSISKEYIVELMGRACEGKERLYGAVGRYFESLISEYEFLDKPSLHERLKEIVNDKFFGEVEPHAWGMCVLRKDKISMANCADRKSGVPRIKDADLDVCTNCPNALRLESNIEEVVILGQSLKAHRDSFKSLGIDVVNDAYEKKLKACRKIVEERKFSPLESSHG